jgi:tetratricopeptide (TPR) repeat protein
MTLVPAPARVVVRRLAVACIAVAVAAAAGCAAKAPPAPPVAPKYPEFVYPAVPADLARSPQARAHDLAWNQLQAGDARGALRAFAQVSRQASGFYPADAGAGWAAMAVEDDRQALEAFDRALQESAAYVPALIGRGEALLSMGREREALGAFEAALNANPDLPDVLRKVEVLRFRGLEEHLVAARSARDAGRLDEAAVAYRRAIEGSPEAPFLYRELAEVERTTGDLAEALVHATKAAQLDPTDAGVFALVGEILEGRGDASGAIDAYQKAQALGADTDLAPRIESLRRKLALAALPKEYQELPEATRVTRGDLAALIGIRLDAVVRAAGQRDVALVTDTRAHWAAAWIDAVSRAGLMDPFPNHTFQPRAAIRRGGLAQVATRVLTVIGRRDRRLAETWTGVRVTFPDMSAGHAMYAAASTAVSAGVIARLEDGGFGTSRMVTGAEAIAAIDRLEALAGRAGLGRSPEGGAR